MATLPFPALQPECPGELARRLFLDVWSGDSIKAVSSGLLLPIGPLPLSVKILGKRVLAPRFPIYSRMSISSSAAVACYTAAFSDDTKNGCVADYGSCYWKKLLKHQIRKIKHRYHLTMKLYTVHEMV